MANQPKERDEEMKRTSQLLAVAAGTLLSATVWMTPAFANSGSGSGGGCSGSFYNVQTPAPGSAAYTDSDAGCSSTSADGGDGTSTVLTGTHADNYDSGWYSQSTHGWYRTSVFIVYLNY